MAQTINTNISSLNAQRNLNSSQSALATSLQRLSSGLRINSAKDDAAGLAISDRMTSQIRGLNQAARNANDGISLSQTGEGALNEVSNNLQRIRELAIQATNSTATAADRVAMDAEVQQRLAEIDRISAQASFNGRKILDGSMGSSSFQVGANVGETISVNLTTSTRNANTGAIASTSTANLQTAAVAATSGSITTAPVTNLNFSVAAAAQVDGKNSMAGATGAAYDFSAATAVVGNNVQVLTGAGGAHNFSVTQGQFDLSDGTNTATVTLTGNYANDAALLAAINAQTGGNFTASVVSGSLKIVGTVAGAVAVTNVDAQAQTLLGLAASNAGYAGGANQNATFSIAGTAVTVNTAVTSQATLVTAINAAITTAGAPLSGYTAAVDGAGVKITKTGFTAAVAITGANASAVNNGIVNSAGTAGTAAVSATAAGFTADAQVVSLTASYATLSALATAVGTQMNTAVPGTYTVTANTTANTLTIARTTTGTGSAAVNITAVSGAAAAAGFATAVGSAGSAAVVGGIAASAFTLATGDLTLLAGTNSAVDLAGTYANLDALVDGINSKVSGVNASNSSGVLSLSSAQAITAGGTKATLAAASGGFGLSATTAANTGNLTTANVLTAAASNTAVQQVDSALEVVNALRGTFGAIQNRFESVIANLQTTSENLVAAQSRIRDTDFAAETAALTRNQILQQAGIAMLAQANALPNQVLTLLRG